MILDHVLCFFILGDFGEGNVTRTIQRYWQHLYWCILGFLAFPEIYVGRHLRRMMKLGFWPSIVSDTWGLIIKIACTYSSHRNPDSTAKWSKCALLKGFSILDPPPWPMAAASLASSYAPFHLSLMAPGQAPLRLRRGLPRFLQAGGAGAGMWRGSRWCHAGSSQSSPERSCRPQVCIPPRGPSGHNSSGCLKYWENVLVNWGSSSQLCFSHLFTIKNPQIWSNHQKNTEQMHRIQSSTWSNFLDSSWISNVFASSCRSASRAPADTLRYWAPAHPHRCGWLFASWHPKRPAESSGSFPGRHPKNPKEPQRTCQAVGSITFFWICWVEKRSNYQVYSLVEGLRLALLVEKIFETTNIDHHCAFPAWFIKKKNVGGKSYDGWLYPFSTHGWLDETQKWWSVTGAT